MMSIPFLKDITCSLPIFFFMNEVSNGLRKLQLDSILATLSYIAEFCVSINAVSLEMKICAKSKLLILTILSEFREV